MALTISSRDNERVRFVRSLAQRRNRERYDRFVVEGTRLVQEAVRAGLVPALVFYTDSWAATAQAQELLPQLAQASEGAWCVSDAVLAACAETQTPQGVLAVLPRLAKSGGVPAQASRSEDGEQHKLQHAPTLILDGLRDPGNLGTILRSAEAAGVDRVLLSPGSVDPYNPKVVRAAMGAHFRLPVSAVDWSAIAEHVAGLPVWLADVAGQTTYDAVDWCQPAALIVGGEASGPTAAARRLATGTVSIPMAKGPESLNAAMAATVILFEAARQRRLLLQRRAEAVPGHTKKTL